MREADEATAFYAFEGVAAELSAGDLPQNMGAQFIGILCLMSGCDLKVFQPRLGFVRSCF